MDLANVLNRRLYARLRRVFGAVRVANSGQSMIARPYRGLENEPKLSFVQEGEYYRICCPFCKETRFRLYISYMFGKRDDFGRRMLFLAHCFNEGCLYRRENLNELVEMVDSLAALEHSQVSPGEIVAEDAREVSLPGLCRRLDCVKPSHPAARYVAGRGFDPGLLARVYGVSYCEDSHYYLARRRLVIPVYDGGKLRGWQARHVGELPWKDPAQKSSLPPKYFSCPNSQFRSRCVYNFRRMKCWETGVVVEGPTDVWRFGAMSGCVFGNTVTDMQRRRLLSAFGGRTLVLLLDPEEFDSKSTGRLCEFFDGKMPGRFAAVKLPDDTDPGSLDRRVLREYVRREALEQGVRVSYTKR